MRLRLCKLTQKQLKMYRRYWNSYCDELPAIYKLPRMACSTNKIEAYKACIADMHRNDGYDMRITAWTTFWFSCAYRVDREDGRYLVYHTRRNRFEFQIMEERG